MSHFMQLQDQNHRKFHISRNLEKSTGSHQSTMWSRLGSNQRSLKGSPDSTSYVVGMFEKMKLPESSYGNTCSNVGPSTYHKSFGQDQIRAIQLSRLKQEQILSLKQKLVVYRESRARIPHQYEPNEEIMQFQKKGKRVGVESGNGQHRTRPIRPAPMPHQTASTAASCGTGVFLPRGGIGDPFGKGCSTVLIPARVVQALQLHFDQMAATPGPKVAGFPPLHDVIVSNRDGMYSLQSSQSVKANNQNEMILPQEWTY
ncbi:PREDICTED: uncharacterized protein LOC109355404 isoform X2 [Lupinus angustifolius]|uniref:uncharacterized protein LOC109355404 isoform X2 n=1 Tax=Lupinus angustifolius TaxID=3871 RepID=UPI00092E3179|nr:PREDICTED: uncharacterized protein LOC109355404 isoform X2 [Lupinus angustifolius]